MRHPVAEARQGDDEGETPMGTLLQDPEAITPETEVVAADDLVGLARMLERLPSREQAILRARFGMESGEPQSYAQIGARYGLSHNRVRQITDRSLRRLRQLVLESDAEGGIPVQAASPVGARKAPERASRATPAAA